MTGTASDLSQDPTFRAYAAAALAVSVNLMGLWVASGIARTKSKTTLNPEDAARMRSDEFREAVTQAVVVAVQRVYLTPDTDPPTGVLRVDELRAEHSGRDEFIAAVREFGQELDPDSRKTLGQVLLDRRRGCLGRGRCARRRLRGVRRQGAGVAAQRGDGRVPLAEVDPGRLALLADGLEVLGLADAEDVGDDVRRHRLDLRVEVPHGGVVVAAGRRDAVLGGGQLLLEGEEVLVGLEVGVGLGDGEQATEGLAQHVLALGLLRRGLPRSHGPGASLDDVLEGAALVGGVPLDGLDEVADEVVPTGELDVDLAPGLLHEVAQPDQPVVGDDRPADDGDEHHDDAGDEGQARAALGGVHALISPRRVMPRASRGAAPTGRRRRPARRADRR